MLTPGAEAVLNWLRSDINERGGTGRRFERFIWDSDLDMSESEIGVALFELLGEHLIIEDVESGKDFGWIYYCPFP